MTKRKTGDTTSKRRYSEKYKERQCIFFTIFIEFIPVRLDISTLLYLLTPSNTTILYCVYQ
jgi:hypothetical protein